MGKVIATFNMTLDGVCDHTAGIPDQEIHDYYSDLLEQGDAILYGRITFELMEYWRSFLETPSEDHSMNTFASRINKISKIVFSNHPYTIDWETARVAERSLEDEVMALKKSLNHIYVGSKSLILQLLNLKLLDELQLLIHPVIEGKGMRLFEGINQTTNLTLIKTKKFKGGAIILYYEVKK